MNEFRNSHIRIKEETAVTASQAEPQPQWVSTAERFTQVRMLVQKVTTTGIKADIALARDEASRFLPWIIALMVYLAALILAGSFTLNRTITAGHNARAQSFSVHMPHMADKEHDVTEKVLALVTGTEGVEDAEIIGSKQIQDMVEPWFGKGDILNTLPLPVVIEAKIKDGAKVDMEGLKAKLLTVNPSATIDDHQQWVAQFAAFIKVMQFTLLCIALLIIFTTASIVIFACKTSLKIHRGTVNLLHRLGAFDTYIATQFQNYAALLTLKGAFIGSGFASITLLALHFAAHTLDSPLFPAFSFTLPHCLILFILPLIMSGLALVVVRFSVLENLRRMP